jgi:hypothetical protein
MMTNEEKKLARKMRGPSQLERVRAARALLMGTAGSEALALDGFLAIFHPEMKDSVRKGLIADVAARERARY